MLNINCRCFSVNSCLLLPKKSSVIIKQSDSSFLVEIFHWVDIKSFKNIKFDLSTYFSKNIKTIAKIIHGIVIIDIGYFISKNAKKFEDIIIKHDSKTSY